MNTHSSSRFGVAHVALRLTLLWTETETHSIVNELQVVFYRLHLSRTLNYLAVVECSTLQNVLHCVVDAMGIYFQCSPKRTVLSEKTKPRDIPEIGIRPRYALPSFCCHSNHGTVLLFNLHHNMTSCQIKYKHLHGVTRRKLRLVNM